MKIIRWLADATGQQVVGSLIGSSFVVAVINWLVRHVQVPTWEMSLVIWTTSALVGFLLSVWLLEHLPAIRRQKSRAPSVDKNAIAIALLERAYMRGMLELTQAQKVLLTEELAGSNHLGVLLQIEKRVDDIRGELMNAAPFTLTTATAIDFQKPAHESVDVRKRVIETTEALLKKIHSKWHAYGGDKAPMPSVAHTAMHSQSQDE